VHSRNDPGIRATHPGAGTLVAQLRTDARRVALHRARQTGWCRHSRDSGRLQGGIATSHWPSSANDSGGSLAADNAAVQYP